MRRVLGFVSISLVLRAAVAIAEDVPAVVTPPVIAVGEEGSDPFETSADSTGFVEVIDAKEVRQGTTTVGELLERSVGVQIQHLGGRDDFSTASIRGATGGQVKVLLDGVTPCPAPPLCEGWGPPPPPPAWLRMLHAVAHNVYYVNCVCDATIIQYQQLARLSRLVRVPNDHSS